MSEWGYLDVHGFVQEAYSRKVAIDAAAEDTGNHALDNGWGGGRELFTVTVGKIHIGFMDPDHAMVDPEDPGLCLVDFETIKLVVWYEDGHVKHRRPRPSDWRW